MLVASLGIYRREKEREIHGVAFLLFLPLLFPPNQSSKKQLHSVEIIYLRFLNKFPIREMKFFRVGYLDATALSK